MAPVIKIALVPSVAISPSFYPSAEMTLTSLLAFWMDWSGEGGCDAVWLDLSVELFDYSISVFE